MRGPVSKLGWVVGGGRVTPCLSRCQATSIWCRETGERVTGAGQLLQPLNQDRWRSLLGSSELASKVMLPATTISVGGGRRVNGSGGLVALIPYCLL